MKPPSVELHIQELVLHGFSPADRYRIGDALRLELARLLAEQGVPPALLRDHEIAQLDGGAFQIAPGSGTAMSGARVAQYVYEGLGR